jgi:hypothetical protein
VVRRGTKGPEARNTSVSDGHHDISPIEVVRRSTFKLHKRITEMTNVGAKLVLDDLKRREAAKAARPLALVSKPFQLVCI